MFYCWVILHASLTFVAVGNIVGEPYRGPIIFDPAPQVLDSLASAGAVHGLAPLMPPKLHGLLPPAAIPFVPDVNLPYAAPGAIPENLYQAPFIKPPAGVPFFSRTFYESAVYPPVVALPYEEAVDSRSPGKAAPAQR